MDICQHCKCQFNSGHTQKCWACYRGLLKNPNFKKRIVKENLIGSPCSNCNKVRLKKWDIDGDLCHSCYLKQYIVKNPDYLEKRRKHTRDYHRRKRGVDTNLPLLNAPAGSGSIKKGQGYRVICKKEFIGLPHCDKKGRIAEHTYVMMQHLGRPLKKGETIHHLNGIRHDNRIENLELWSTSHPPGQRVKDKIKWCKEFLSQYESFA